MTPVQAVFVLTAYGIGCDAPGPLTKAGTIPVAEFTAAADPTELPIGSIVEIEGLGLRMIHDVGGKVRGRHIDVFMDKCQEARAFGRQTRRVRILHLPKGVAHGSF